MPKKKAQPGFFDRETNELAGLGYPEYEDGEPDEDEDQEGYHEIQTAAELSQTEFDSLPFDEYYKKLLSEPERNFWMLIYGLPWQGKTTFCVGFAKYLAENFGRVLYISSEQYRSKALKNVLNHVQAGGVDQLHFTPSLRKAPPFDEYDFIFIDSANAAGLSIEDLKAMRDEDENKGKAFITVLQSVKSGDFHGKQGWRHYPNIVVKIHAHCANVEKNQYANKPVTLPLPKLSGKSENDFDDKAEVKKKE